MELLLFLSALLSALTGAISGGRAPEIGVHQSVGATVVGAVRCAVRAAPLRRERHWLDLVSAPRLNVAMPVGSANLALAALQPLYLNQPRA